MIISRYEVEGPVNCKIAFVADLHEKDPAPVIEKLKEISPDIILVGGDVFERHDTGEDPKLKHMLAKATKREKRRKLFVKHLYLCMRFFIGRNVMNHENAYRFFEEASKIAPVYLSRGNHEWYYAPEDMAVIKKYNVCFLDNEFTDWNGILIGGLSPKYDNFFLDRMNNSKGYKILLCHHPEYYRKMLTFRNFDLVLAGHAHGGQIRIFGKGIFSPGQGLFPELTRGMYFEHMIVTSGCANTAQIPRIGNPLEVVEINMKKA